MEIKKYDFNGILSFTTTTRMSSILVKMIIVYSPQCSLSPLAVFENNVGPSANDR